MKMIELISRKGDQPSRQDCLSDACGNFFLKKIIFFFANSYTNESQY